MTAGFRRALSPRYPVDLSAWQKLREHAKSTMADADMRRMFSRDRNRAQRFSLTACDLTLNYSRNLINATTRSLLTSLAREAGVEVMRDAMFAGEHINETEDRAVLHVALRAAPRDRFRDGRQNCTRDVHAVLDGMERFVNGVHRGRHRGATGERFSDVVNIGIGGSDLGIDMALAALGHLLGKRPRVHCVSNVDGTQLADLTRRLDPATTLFVICSKTFTTQETMTNAAAARRWVRRKLGDDAVSAHFAAASTNHSAMDEFGINPDYRFGFWDWVGGRFSLWSAVGLSIALGVGMAQFRELLAGGRDMDRHFRTAALGENLPVIMALLAVWYSNFLGVPTHAILPYDNRLRRFPAFLQQMQMESNGKSARIDGKAVRCRSGQIIWGEPGNNAQHSFYQLLHQGTHRIAVDFILPARSSGASQRQQNLAIANCLAQSQALCEGQAAPDDGSGLHRAYAGNNPSSVLLLGALTPRTLGQLVALYEHKVFVEGVIYGINSFDQWGVELGKRLARTLEGPVRAGRGNTLDNPASAELVDTVARLRQ
ncbi:MAG: glucose-6-phosphate isomerase [Pseudomonadota bacterium]